MIYGNGIKRLMDFSLALAALALLSVPFLLLALLLALANRGTPFFRQTRPGRGGQAVPHCQIQDHDGCP